VGRYSMEGGDKRVKPEPAKPEVVVQVTAEGWPRLKEALQCERREMTCYQKIDSRSQKKGLVGIRNYIGTAHWITMYAGRERGRANCNWLIIVKELQRKGPLASELGRV